MRQEDLYKLEVVGQVLFVRLTGVWSASTVRKVFAEVQVKVAPIQDKPWAAYVDMRNWIMPTLEAQQGFAQIYEWCAANNQTHEATVCKFDMQKRIVGEVSSYDTQTQLYTQNPRAAIDWLNEKGFACQLPSPRKSSQTS
ncbi:hypothetical protein [Bowmanella dokdonensis]|uniref:Uncharacterized protein n=1 Tax=Bowmanella dokdonensis TaxID=751969 RepID=A0A939DQV1_9ALTE|nr:hypothetical protein [Bowmanella dokdonensis]MBN7826251.1 hypothetical protein [Bowmanella dokdonensis]